MTEPTAEIKYLSTEDLLWLAGDLGVGPVTDVGLLDSAAHRPTASIFGRDAYGSIDDKAATLLESIIRNPALVDGNKRLGWLSLVVFYGLNNIEFDAPEDDAYDMVIAVASGELTYQEVATGLRSRVARDRADMPSGSDAFPVISVGRRITSNEVVEALDEE